MKFAFADPPYLGCGNLYDAHHIGSREYDDPEAHKRLIERLVDEYPDGWVMSLSAPSLRTILPMTPADCRVGAWVKPFASFKPNIGIAYAWEPVIFRGGRRVTRQEQTRRDWLAESITLRKGLTGAKPPRFCRWVFSILNARPSDQMDDLFPGTGIVDESWSTWGGVVEIGGQVQTKPSKVGGIVDLAVLRKRLLFAIID